MNSDLLKKVTQEQHDNIERVMNANLLFSNQFTVSHYQQFITKSYQYIINIHNTVRKDLPDFFFLIDAKHNAIEKDMKDLALSLPTNKTITPIYSPNKFYSLGLLYVVVGAMLGNKIILKKLKEDPNFEHFSFHYLNAHQDKVSEIWKNFQATINALSEEELENVIQGAKEGYTLFSK